eukprot:jgi/Hompol1/5162/HPOL_004189-RA
MYKDTGTVFFMDRTVYGGEPEDPDGLGFFLEMVPEPSEYAIRNGRLVTGISIHEGESGVVVWNKTRNLHAVLLSCSMNAEPFKSLLYSVFNGDKETYWIAHEALEMPYSWAPGAGGAIGYEWRPNQRSVICGGLYHPDESWRPLWFNGGMIRNKRNTPEGNKRVEMQYWATDREFRTRKREQVRYWIWETDTTPMCLITRSVHTETGELTAREKEIAQMMADLWENEGS